MSTTLPPTPTSATPFSHPQPDLQTYTLETQSRGNQNLTPAQGEEGVLREPYNAVEARKRKLRGVAKVEAAQGVWGKRSKWWLYLGLALASYIYSLDGSTTWFYLSYAQSSFGQHSLIGTIQTAQGIIIAIGKPPMAKLADVIGRAEAYMIVVFFYCLGYIVIASAQGTGALAAGIILYAVGYTGLQILSQIIIADITSLRYRGMVSALISAPFLVNGFIASNVYSSVYEHAGWRWGYGMFAILVPAALSPLIVTLSWAQWKAKKLGLIGSKDEEEFAMNGKKITVVQKGRDFAEELDVVGLLLLAAGWACLLVPVTLASSTPSKFGSGNMIAMLVIGPILLALFLYWELKWAKVPVVAWRFLRNRNIVGAALIGFFDFVAFYLSYLFLYSFIVVTKPWSLVNIGYFSLCISVALTFFGIIAGFIMVYWRRWKILLIIGLCIRLLGAGLMIHSRGAKGTYNAITVPILTQTSTAAELVMNQILQGWGGGFAAIIVQVAAQGSVAHVDVATVTAVVLLITEMGTSVGNAIAGGVWANEMPGYLEKYLPATVNATERATIFGSITVIAAYDIDDPIRVGATNAYEAVMKKLTIAATCVAVIPLLIGIFVMKDFRLSDRQNELDQSDLAGKPSSDTDSAHTHTEEHGGAGEEEDLKKAARVSA